MKKLILSAVLAVAAFAASADVITNTVVIVSNTYNNVFHETVVTQKVQNTHFNYYFTNHETVVIHESHLISQTNKTVNLDVGNSYLIAASNQANRAASAVGDARDFADASAGSASAAASSASSASASASSASATRSAAASECASALATINERINWFDQHSGETITQVNYNYTTNLYFAEDSVARSAASSASAAASAASASASANAASIASLESRVGDNISTLQTRMGTAEGDISGLKSRMSSAEDKINCPIKKYIYSIYRLNPGSGQTPIEMGYITVNAGKFTVFSRTDTVLKLRYDFTYTKLNTSAAVYIGYVEKQFNTAASSAGDKAITSIQFSIGNGQPYYLYTPLAEGHTESVSSITDLAVRPTKSPHRQVSAGGLYVGEFWWEANGTETIEVRGPIKGNGSIESPSGSFLPQLVAMKDDVEDRISDVEDSIDSIDTRLSSAESSISGNTTAIGQHGTRLSSAESSISGNATAIGQLGTRLSSAESSISGNTTAIGTMTTAIGQHGTRLSSVESSASGNAAAIGQLETRVSSVESSASGNATAIGQLGTRVSSVEADIVSLQNSISGIESGSPHKYEHDGTTYNNVTVYSMPTDEGKVKLTPSGSSSYATASYLVTPGYRYPTTTASTWVFRPAYVDTDASGLRIQYVCDEISSISYSSSARSRMVVPEYLYWQNGYIYMKIKTFTDGVQDGSVVGRVADANYPNTYSTAKTISKTSGENWSSSTVATIKMNTQMNPAGSDVWVPATPSAALTPIISWMVTGK